MSDINARSSKEEVISAALELTDSQATTIATLKSQQSILWCLLTLSVIWSIVF